MPKTNHNIKRHQSQTLHLEHSQEIQHAKDWKDDKHTKYPELTHSSECKFLGLAGEIGGRWSATASKLIRDLARKKSQSAAPRLRRSTAFVWENRWWGMLSVAVQNAFAATIVDDAQCTLHAWEGTGPPLGVLLHGEAPTVSRLPLREGGRFALDAVV